RRQVCLGRPALLDLHHQQRVRRARIGHPPHARLVHVEAHRPRQRRVRRTPPDGQGGKVGGSRARTTHHQPHCKRQLHDPSLHHLTSLHRTSFHHRPFRSI